MFSTSSGYRATLVRICSTLVRGLSHRMWAGIGVIVAIILALLTTTSRNGPPTSPGVYSLHDISAGEMLAENLVEARGDVGSVIHPHPVTLEQVIGLCLTKDIEENAQLTLEHLDECTPPKTSE